MDLTTTESIMTPKKRHAEEETDETEVSTEIKSVTDLASRLDKSAEEGRARVLGNIVWWDAEGAEALKDDVVKAVESVGLPKASCPGIEARGASKKALEALGLRASPQSGKKKDVAKKTKGKKAAPAQADPKDEARLFYDRLVDDSERIVIAVSERVVENADGAHPVARYVERQTITYDRESKSIKCSSAFMRSEIETAFKKYCLTYRANEIRTVIQNVLDNHAKAIRVRDGVYFVPGSLATWVEKLRELAAKLTNVKVTKVSILDVAGGEREDMRDLAGAAIKGELEALAADLQKMQEIQAEKGVTARDGTYQARLAKYAELREKARVYQDLLAIETNDVESGLAALTEKVEKLMGATPRKRS